MKKILQRLNIAYYTALFGSVIFALIGYWLAKKAGIHYDALTQPGITISYVTILYIILSIPGALAWFHQQTKKMKQQPNTYEKLQKYIRISYIRLLLIAIGLWGGIVVFYLLDSTSVLWCAAMAAIAIVFCKPAEQKIQDEIEQPEQSEQPENNTTA
ncbi:MAG: hypothetical protein IJ680_06470 [Paludibacteraceae bacterium]|nr:hypothetical protein [Paludibacteraceae bacterium]